MKLGDTIGERIRNARRRKGMSQRELADRMNNLGIGKIGRPSIAQWENGDIKEIKATNLLKAAHVLGVHPETLIFGKLLIRIEDE